MRPNIKSIQNRVMIHIGHRFYRMRVKLIILEPLKKCMPILINPTLLYIGALRYERLPAICYACWRIGPNLPLRLNSKIMPNPVIIWYQEGWKKRGLTHQILPSQDTPSSSHLPNSYEQKLSHQTKAGLELQSESDQKKPKTSGEFIPSSDSSEIIPDYVLPNNDHLAEPMGTRFHRSP